MIRDLSGGLAGFRVFLACLALGVAAIAAVGTVRESITEGLSREGAVILGGDASIELTYRFASEDERDWMDAAAVDVSEIVDFRSMAVVGEGAADHGAVRGCREVQGLTFDAHPQDARLPGQLGDVDGNSSLFRVGIVVVSRTAIGEAEEVLFVATPIDG